MLLCETAVEEVQNSTSIIPQLCVEADFFPVKAIGRGKRQTGADPPELFSGAEVEFVCVSQTFQGMSCSSKLEIQVLTSLIRTLFIAGTALVHRKNIETKHVTWGHYCSQTLRFRVCIWKFIVAEYISGKVPCPPKAALYQEISFSSATGYHFKWSVSLSGKTTAKKTNNETLFPGLLSIEV